MMSSYFNKKTNIFKPGEINSSIATHLCNITNENLEIAIFKYTKIYLKKW